VKGLLVLSKSAFDGPLPPAVIAAALTGALFLVEMLCLHQL
jgi:hypothetical protein